MSWGPHSYINQERKTQEEKYLLLCYDSNHFFFLYLFSEKLKCQNFNFMKQQVWSRPKCFEFFFFFLMVFPLLVLAKIQASYPDENKYKSSSLRNGQNLLWRLSEWQLRLACMLSELGPWRLHEENCSWASEANSSPKRKFSEIPSTPSNGRQALVIHGIFLLFFSVISSKGGVSVMNWNVFRNCNN